MFGSYFKRIIIIIIIIIIINFFNKNSPLEEVSSNTELVLKI